MILFLLLLLALFAWGLFNTITRLRQPYPHFAAPVSFRQDVTVLIVQLLLLVWVLALLVSDP